MMRARLRTTPGVDYRRLVVISRALGSVPAGIPVRAGIMWEISASVVPLCSWLRLMGDWWTGGYAVSPNRDPHPFGEAWRRLRDTSSP